MKSVAPAARRCLPRGCRARMSTCRGPTPAAICSGPVNVLTPSRAAPANACLVMPPAPLIVLVTVMLSVSGANVSEAPFTSIARR